MVLMSSRQCCLTSSLHTACREKHLDRLTHTYHASKNAPVANKDVQRIKPGHGRLLSRIPMGALDEHGSSMIDPSPFGPLGMHSPSTSHVRSESEQSVLSSGSSDQRTIQAVAVPPKPFELENSSQQTKTLALLRETGNQAGDRTATRQSFWYALLILRSVC